MGPMGVHDIYKLENVFMVKTKSKHKPGHKPTTTIPWSARLIVAAVVVAGSVLHIPNILIMMRPSVSPKRTATVKSVDTVSVSAPATHQYIFDTKKSFER